MIEFGRTLRIAREAKGYTTSQIADRTRMLVQIVEGLEDENFSRIVAPIYGRGFVKLYCEAVGLDPKPLVEAFMEIYSGNRETVIRERGAPATDADGAPTAPEPAPAPAAAAKAEPASEPPAPKPDEFDFGVSSGPSRYATPMPIDDERGFRLPAVNVRLVILFLGALLVVLSAAFGIRALYRATMGDPSAPDAAERPAKTAAEAPETSAPPTSGGDRRQPLALNPFYID